MFTPEERRLSVYLRTLSILFFLAIFGYLLPALTGPLQDFYVNLPFVTNSVVKIGTLWLLAWIASVNVREHRTLIVIVVWGHVISIAAMGFVLAFGKTDYDVNVGTITMPIANMLWGAIVMDGVILIALIYFFFAAEKARFQLVYFSPTEFRTLVALAEVVIQGTNEILSPEDVARNVDRYLGAFKARSKWIMKLVLTGMNAYPMLTFRPPLPYIEAGERLKFLKKRFYDDSSSKLIPPFWRMITQGMIRMSKQLCYLGYYNDPRTFESVGYKPFTQRPDFKTKLAVSPPPPRKTLTVKNASEIDSDHIIGDFVIVGSGAAASILAYELVRAGKDVLMVERGNHVEPDRFSEDEMEMISKLYADGALQLSRDFRFQVLQGSCVGGTTVVNNAVCFDLPKRVFDRWNDQRGLSAGLDEKRLYESFAWVRKFLKISPQPNNVPYRNLSAGGDLFYEGCKKLGLDVHPSACGVVDANITGCLGCGYCNIGCRYGKKMSMLDAVLPEAQKIPNAGQLRIVAGCEVEKIHGGKKISHLIGRFHNGRAIKIAGNTFVVSAGAVSSSLLLMKSGVAAGRAGKRLSFNMGSPITASFEKIVNAYDGLQITHYLKRSEDDGFVLETWFNPPTAQAINMPGWFEDHFNNMLRFNKLASIGVLVGTESNAEVRLAGLTGREIKYIPTKSDFEKLLNGLILAGDIFLAAGAKSIMPNSFKFYEFFNENELRTLPEKIKNNSQIGLGTGHPQGGNIMSLQKEFGVVDNRFKVYGYDNLFICDASVFPSSIGVNPQLTVMALAHYAAPHILGML
ncbi:GMC family oxidoreductase [bacterium]|nr:GMC family oxidoreductase [bacterium]